MPFEDAKFQTFKLVDWIENDARKNRGNSGQNIRINLRMKPYNEGFKWERNKNVYNKRWRQEPRGTQEIYLSMEVSTKEIYKGMNEY